MASILKELQTDIEDKKNGYNRNSIRSFFNTEKKYTESYKGREILEIIQNAEDAKANELIFTIDKKQNKIIISNNGDDFSLEGYRSLLYPDLSAKPKGVFIGQKGLGFRALINWAKEISIISNGLKVTFSEDISTKLLEDLKSCDKKLSNITKMQFLSIPEIQEIPLNKKGVTLELLCKDNIDFEKQFKTIDKECLFFLNNLKEITNIEEQMIITPSSYKCTLK